MDVIFEIPKGKRFTIEVGYFDTVLEIKEKIQKYEGFPVSRQILVFNGQIMADERDTEYYEILHRSRIQLILEPEPPAATKAPVSVAKVEESSSSSTSPSRKLQILITMSKKQYPISMDSTDTVAGLKEKVHEAEGLPLNRFSLSFKGVDLLEGRSLKDYSIPDLAEVNVVVKPSSPVTTTSSVTVAGSGPLPATPTTTGATTNSKKLKLMVLPKGGTKKIAVEVNPSDNVVELRKELQKLQHQHRHLNVSTEYFFIYNQNVMEDDQSFRWHNVRPGDTIEIFHGSITGGS